MNEHIEIKAGRIKEGKRRELPKNAENVAGTGSNKVKYGVV